MKRCITQTLYALAGACALVSSASTSAQATTNLLTLTTFDPAAGSPWGYPYLYGNNGLGLSEYNKEYYLPEDIEMTNAMWYFHFDLTDLSGTLGYGTGTGGPLAPVAGEGSFVSAEREDYIVTFDARVEGLDAAQANAEMQVSFFMPAEAGAQKILQVNYNFNPTAAWQTFRRTLDQGGLADNTSDSIFATNHANANEVRFGVNFHEPHNQFGYDGGNVLYLDNFKVEVVSRPIVVPVETFPVVMAEWNFDDKLATSEYHYEWAAPTASEVRLAVTAGNNANGNDPNTLGVNGTGGWFLTLDNSAFLFDPPAWAGGGSGGNGAVDFTLFDSGNLADYRVSFDARVEGLAVDRTASAAVLQLFLDAPDDTFEPAGDENGADLIARLDFPIAQVSPEWQTYTFLLNKGGSGQGSKDLFTAHYAVISALRTQWQIENAGSVADWDYDTDNTLVIDNFKLERLYTQPVGPKITAARDGNQIVLTWTAPSGSNIKLQAAPAVTGPYADVADASSGYTIDATGSARFFRLLQQ